MSGVRREHRDTGEKGEMSPPPSGRCRTCGQDASPGDYRYGQHWGNQTASVTRRFFTEPHRLCLDSHLSHQTCRTKSSWQAAAVPFWLQNTNQTRIRFSTRIIVPLGKGCSLVPHGRCARSMVMHSLWNPISVAFP